MKMKTEHYELIKKAMKEKLETISETVKERYFREIQLDPRVKDINKRIRWDLYHVSGGSKFSVNMLYDYLDDTHIDTALTKIQKDLKWEIME